jgi:ATP-dependent DNA helicase RecG
VYQNLEAFIDMNNSNIRKLLSQGENLTVEFKVTKDTLSNSVFETVCSFSNRYGGYLFLGVGDSGEVSRNLFR